MTRITCCRTLSCFGKFWIMLFECLFIDLCVGIRFHVSWIATSKWNMITAYLALLESAKLFPKEIITYLLTIMRLLVVPFPCQDLALLLFYLFLITTLMCVQHYFLMTLFLLEAFPCSQAEFCRSACTVHSVRTINGQVMIFKEIRISAMERTSWKEHFQVGSIFYTSNISCTMWNFVIIPVCALYIAFHVLKLEQLKIYIFLYCGKGHRYKTYYFNHI